MTAKNKILIVEDNDFVRAQLAKFLLAEGYEVEEAADGGQAITKLRADEAIDIAVVDVRMEPIGGFEFLKMIRGFELKTSVILVTGDQNPDLLTEAGRWGVEAVLMKPVQKDRLVKAVQRTIQARTRA